MAISKKLRTETPLKSTAVAGGNEDMLEVDIAGDDEPEGEQPDGSVVVDIGGKSREESSPQSVAFGDNLVDVLDEQELLILASELEHDIENDKRSRSEWEKTYKDGLSLLGLKIEERTEPWDGACGIVHPMITEAVVRFQAETVTETFPASGPVRSKILGLENSDTKERAKRVEEDMNWRLTEEMPEFRAEHERMLWELPCVGSTFKKVYYDTTIERQTSVFISAEDVILPYGTTNIYACHRVTHVMRKTADAIRRLMEAGFYDEFEIDDTPPKETDDVKDSKDKEQGVVDLYDDRYVVYEAHVDLVIKSDPERGDTKVAFPYVITFMRHETARVLSVRRNWKEDDKNKKKRQHFVQYNYVPGFGAYGYGLFHLIGGYAKGATAILRQLVDSGTLANLPGGLKAKGLRITGGDTPIRPGEWRDVDLGGGKIADNIMPIPYKEPSATLQALFDKIIEDGRRFAATADLQVSDMSSQAPVGTTLAILERQLKVLTAVQQRVHDSLKKELALLKEVISDYTPDSYEYEPSVGKKSDKKKDYEAVDVIPVSDPNATTLSQRVVQGQTALQMAQMAPEVYDMAHLHRVMLETLGLPEVEKIVPLPEDMKPLDPVSENMAILNCKPVKAFIYQDHAAHIAVHTAAAQDPVMMQMLGQNPKAPMIMAAAQAHIVEHMAYAYRQRIEIELGMTLPPEGENLPPQVEVAISGMMAQASQQVLAQSKAMAATMAAQAAANDPALMIQQQELGVKKHQAETQRLKVQVDAADKADKTRLAEAKLQAEGVKTGIDANHKAAQIAGQNLQAGVKTGMDAAGMRHDQHMQVAEHQHNVQTGLRDQQHQHKMDERQQAHQETMDHKTFEQGAQQFGAQHQLATSKMQGEFSSKAHSAITQDNFQRDKMGHDAQQAQEQRAHDATMQTEQATNQSVQQEQQRAHDMAKTKLAVKSKTQTAQLGGKKPAAKKPAGAKRPPKK